MNAIVGNGADLQEVIHRMTAVEFARLIDVALGKLASPSDWEVILKAHAALDKSFERGRQLGREEATRELLGGVSDEALAAIGRAQQRGT